MLYLSRGVIPMTWKILRKLAGADAKAEARAATRSAEASLERAKAQTTEIKQLVGRIEYHGRRNHLGERLEAAIKGL